jgi:hypothetical protein
MSWGWAEQSTIPLKENRTRPLRGGVIRDSYRSEATPNRSNGRQIAVFSSNQAALLALSQPPQQSSQSSIEEVYNAVRALKRRNNRVRLVWLPSGVDFELSRKAKEAAVGPPSKANSLLMRCPA